MYKFTLDLYKNKSDNNVLHKVLTGKYTIKGVSRADFDILTPSIIVTSAKANDYNYCYIQELHRYYYITHCVVNTDKTITLSFKVDVLMTYADDILASRGLITKQADYTRITVILTLKPKQNNARLNLRMLLQRKGNIY